MPDESFLPIGRVRKAHGIKGEVSVEYYADSPDLLCGGVYLQVPGQAPVFRSITSFRAHHGSLLVLFSGIIGRDAAEALRQCDILVPENRFPEPDDGGIYLHEILGLRVIAVTAPENESDWGTITDIADNAGQEMWTISQPGEEDVLFPAAPELVLAFDLAARIVRIAPPPGLLDLYRS